MNTAFFKDRRSAQPAIRDLSCTHGFLCPQTQSLDSGTNSEETYGACGLYLYCEAPAVEALAQQCGLLWEDTAILSGVVKSLVKRQCLWLTAVNVWPTSGVCCDVMETVVL